MRSLAILLSLLFVAACVIGCEEGYNGQPDSGVGPNAEIDGAVQTDESVGGTDINVDIDTDRPLQDGEGPNEDRAQRRQERRERLRDVLDEVDVDVGDGGIDVEIGDDGDRRGVDLNIE